MRLVWAEPPPPSSQKAPLTPLNKCVNVCHNLIVNHIYNNRTLPLCSIAIVTGIVLRCHTQQYSTPQSLLDSQKVRGVPDPPTLDDVNILFQIKKDTLEGTGKTQNLGLVLVSRKYQNM